MNPAALEILVQIVGVIVSAFIGSYFGSYLKKKGENIATKEDFELLLEQLKKTTAETESIRVDLAKGNWLHQQSWTLKEKYYSGLLEALYSLKMSLSSRLDNYIAPGSEHYDDVINEKEHYKKQSRIEKAVKNRT